MALVRLSIPFRIVMANILATAYQMTDTFWVGRLSAEAVAAVTLCFPINFLMIAIGAGLPIAGSVLIAQFKGRGEERQMNHVAGQTLLMVLGVSIVLTAFGYWLSEPIIRLMSNDPAVIPDAAVRFLQITFIGFVFVFGFFVYQSLTRGLGVVMVPMLIVAVTVLLNFILDPLFIFGWGPFPAMGVAGAAMATLCTQALAAAIGFGLLFSGRHGLRPGLRDFRPDLALLGKTIRLGIPASVEQSRMRAMALFVMTLLVSGFGSVAVAAYGVGLRIITFVMIPAMGLSMATTTIVACKTSGMRENGPGGSNEYGCLLDRVLCSDAGRRAALYFCRSALDDFRAEGRRGYCEECAVHSHHFACDRLHWSRSRSSAGHFVARVTRWPRWCCRSSRRG